MLAILLLLAVAAEPNKNLEEAARRVQRGEFGIALEELQLAGQLPGNSIRQRARIEALRASALVGLQPPMPENERDAAGALLEMYHLDPEGSELGEATEAAKALAQKMHSERLLILHERLVTARSGRPLRVRARLAGARPGSGAEPQLFLNYRPLTGEEPEYVRVQMDRAATADTYETWLRPGVGAMPARGEQVVDYFIEALGPAGAALDSNGAALDPIRLQLSETLPEAAGLAALDEGGKPAHPYVPPPRAPWYKRWGTVGPIGAALGVVIAGGVVALVLLQPKPQPASGSLGRVDLP
jgi:hypothetical protein